MDQGWSRRLIAQMLAVEHREDPSDHTGDHTGRVSHETIYQALYVQTRGGLRADLHRQLSLKRRQRVARTRDRRASSPYKEAFTISQRPPEVADRAVPGHWEGDLIVGPESKSAIGTLVERSTRFTILLHLPGSHDANTVAEAMIKEMGHLPEHLRRSITWDRGSELADYARIQVALETKLSLRRPALALATRHQREHQPAPAALVRQRHRPVPSTAPRTSVGSPPPSTPDPARPWTCRPPPCA